MENDQLDAIVIGAGVTGITIALELKRMGRKVLIVEKSRGVGGRIATRREGEFAFDHGAQFFKMSQTNLPNDKPPSPESHQGEIRRLPVLIQHCIESEKAKIWFSEKGSDFWACPNGMTQLPKSANLTDHLLLNTKVSHLAWNQQARTWRIEFEGGQNFRTATQVFLTPPLPQSLAILSASNIPYDRSLEKIQYAPALVGLFSLGQTTALPQKMYRQNVSESIFSISDQFSKGTSPRPALTVTMQAGFSAQFFDQPEDQTLLSILELLRNEAKLELADTEIISMQLKKWRYSHPLSFFDRPFFELENRSLILAGDAFGGGSIMGAMASAQRAIKL